MKSKTFSKLKVIFFFFIFILGCEKNYEEEKEPISQEVEQMLQVIEKSGIVRDRVEVKDDYFLVDGDIKIMFNSIDEIEDYLSKEHNNKGLKAYEYPNPYYVNLSNAKDIKIYVASSVTTHGWSGAVAAAIDEWNDISPLCSIGMSIVNSSSNADVIVSTYYQNSNTIALGEACVNGSVGSSIEINTYYDHLTDGTKKCVLAHELGHTIGFAHSDGTSSFTIPRLIDGTTTVSNTACVMYPQAHSWNNGFHSDEVLGAIEKYPKPFDVNISGPSKGYNQGTYTWTSSVSGGTPPYQYNWEYKYTYNDATWRPFSTSPSITAPLPLDLDLILRLTVTDQLGVTGTDLHITINMGDRF